MICNRCRKEIMVDVKGIPIQYKGWCMTCFFKSNKQTWKSTSEYVVKKRIP